MDLWQKLEELKKTSLSDIQKADDEKKVNDIRVSLLGKKGNEGFKPWRPA